MPQAVFKKILVRKKVGYKMLYSVHGFISDHITIYNRSYLLSSLPS